MEENNCLCLLMKRSCCVYSLHCCYERLKCSIEFFAFIIIITNEKKRVKYVIIKHAESPTYILST